LGVVTAFGEVLLVRKNGGANNGKLFAMKKIKINDACCKELRIHRRIKNIPFLVEMYYAFKKGREMSLVLGEYIKSISDSKIFEKLSKKYNDRKCRSDGWERAVTGTEHIHTTFIILNGHTL
jgi:hypothetical protein